MRRDNKPKTLMELFREEEQAQARKEFAETYLTHPPDVAPIPAAPSGYAQVQIGDGPAQTIPLNAVQFSIKRNEELGSPVTELTTDPPLPPDAHGKIVLGRDAGTPGGDRMEITLHSKAKTLDWQPIPPPQTGSYQEALQRMIAQSLGVPADVLDPDSAINPNYAAAKAVQRASERLMHHVQAQPPRRWATISGAPLGTGSYYRAMQERGNVDPDAEWQPYLTGNYTEADLTQLREKLEQEVGYTDRITTAPVISSITTHFNPEQPVTQDVTMEFGASPLQDAVGEVLKSIEAQQVLADVFAKHSPFPDIYAADPVDTTVYTNAPPPPPLTAKGLAQLFADVQEQLAQPTTPLFHPNQDLNPLGFEDVKIPDMRMPVRPRPVDLAAAEISEGMLSLWKFGTPLTDRNYLRHRDISMATPAAPAIPPDKLQTPPPAAEETIVELAQLVPPAFQELLNALPK